MCGALALSKATSWPERECLICLRQDDAFVTAGNYMYGHFRR
jgi:hypothetical protein